LIEEEEDEALLAEEKDEEALISFELELGEEEREELVKEDEGFTEEVEVLEEDDDWAEGLPLFR